MNIKSSITHTAYNNTQKEHHIDEMLLEKTSLLHGRNRVLYWGGGIVSVLVIIGIILFSLSNKTEVEKMNDVFLVELATGMADKISAIMKNSTFLIKTGKEAVLQQAPSEQAMLDALYDIKGVSGFDNLYISFYGNTPLDGSRIPLKTAVPFSLNNIADDEVFVSDPSVDEYSGRKFFTVGTPLYIDEVKIGELYGVYYLDNFSELLSLKSFGGEAFFHLCTVEGIPLVLSGNSDNLFKDGDMYTFISSLNMQNEHTVESIREDMQNGETTLLKYMIQKENRTAVMVTVPNTNWCVISIILSEVTVAMANEINQTTLLFSIFMIVIFGGFVTSSLVSALRKEAVLKKALLSSRQLAKKLKLTVETDSLTKVYSRATATERIIDIISTSEASEQKHTLMIADIDNFKLINDTYGHQIGDIYLLKFVEAVEKCLRAQDVFGRLGGDEFIILLQDIDSKEDARKVSMRILESVNAITIPDVSLEKVGISLGLVMIPMFGVDYETLNNMADKALYRAKHAGKSTYIFYGDSTENEN